jgi:hypothetical protein
VAFIPLTQCSFKRKHCDGFDEVFAVIASFLREASDGFLQTPFWGEYADFSNLMKADENVLNEQYKNDAFILAITPAGEESPRQYRTSCNRDREKM